MEIAEVRLLSMFENFLRLAGKEEEKSVEEGDTIITETGIVAYVYMRYGFQDKTKKVRKYLNGYDDYCPCSIYKIVMINGTYLHVFQGVFKEDKSYPNADVELWEWMGEVEPFELITTKFKQGENTKQVTQYQMSNEVKDKLMTIIAEGIPVSEAAYMSGPWLQEGAPYLNSYK